MPIYLGVLASIRVQTVSSGIFTGLVIFFQIERIQNRTLYEQYEARKKNLSSQKHRKNKLERLVWHGTDCNVVASIERNGFNRSYCGVHGKSLRCLY